MIGVLLRLPLCVAGLVADVLLGAEEPFEYRYSTTPPDDA